MSREIEEIRNYESNSVLLSFARLVGLRLIDQFANTLLEFVNFAAHFVDAPHDVVIHLAEACLHLSQHRLYEFGQVLRVIDV